MGRFFVLPSPDAGEQCSFCGISSRRWVLIGHVIILRLRPRSRYPCIQLRRVDTPIVIYFRLFSYADYFQRYVPPFRIAGNSRTVKQLR